MSNIDQTKKDIEQTMGSFPDFFNGVPENVLVQMWPIMKKYELGQSEIPPKYREMIGLAVAATLKCPYCEVFHRGTAKLYGATEEELKEVGTITGHTAFWSSVLHAQHYDVDTFTKEAHALGDNLSKKGQSMTA